MSCLLNLNEIMIYTIIYQRRFLILVACQIYLTSDSYGILHGCVSNIPFTIFNCQLWTTKAHHNINQTAKTAQQMTTEIIYSTKHSTSA